MRTEGEFRALLSLLSDEQEPVAKAAWDALLQAGDDAVPYLQEAFNAPDVTLRGRARALLEELRISGLESRWREFLRAPDERLDLERGCLLLAGITGAEVNERAVQSFLDVVAGTVRAHMVASGGLHALGEVLFDNLGFRGGDFDNPDHHYLPAVLDRRRGVPIALAAVYIIVGRRAGLPVYGVAMPDHFLALYERADQPAYVDCFNRGQIYRYETLHNLLARRGMAYPDQILAPCSHRFTLYRMLNNLDRVYTESGNDRLAARVRRWRSHIQVEMNG
ncbi:MAG: transglutaminase family protein [Bacillota bacterium]